MGGPGAAGPLTGAGLNPARVLGPAIVHNYRWDAAWYYVLAELVGGALAGLAAVPLYGGGRFAWWDRNDEVRSGCLQAECPCQIRHISLCHAI